MTSGNEQPGHDILVAGWRFGQSEMADGSATACADKYIFQHAAAIVEATAGETVSTLTTSRYIP